MGGGSVGGGGEGLGGSGGGGARCWMVTSVYTQAEMQYARDVERPSGGEEESSELMRAAYLQLPSPSRSLAAVVLGAVKSKIHRAGSPLAAQSGSQ